MSKWANYLIGGAVISMLMPIILRYFELLNNIYFWPVLSMILVSVGISIHFAKSLSSGSMSVSTIFLLSSILCMIYGFSLVEMNVESAEYLLLLGGLIIAFWIIFPVRKKNGQK